MEMSRLSNRELIRHLVGADADDPLWREFLARFLPRLRLVVYRNFVSEQRRAPGVDTGGLAEAVEDLTQEVFLRLLDSDRRALSQFRGRNEASIQTYLSSIAVNLVRDHFKKLRALKIPKVARSLSDPTEDDEGRPLSPPIESPEPGPDRLAASEELREQIQAAVDDASPRETTTERDRTVFQLYFVEGLRAHEIAAVGAIRLTTSGVEKCIRRIRDAVQKKISGIEGGPGG